VIFAEGFEFMKEINMEEHEKCCNEERKVTGDWTKSIIEFSFGVISELDGGRKDDRPQRLQK